MFICSNKYMVVKKYKCILYDKFVIITINDLNFIKNITYNFYKMTLVQRDYEKFTVIQNIYWGETINLSIKIYILISNYN